MIGLLRRLRKAKQERVTVAAILERKRRVDSKPLVFEQKGTHRGCGGTIDRATLGDGSGAQYCQTCQRFLPSSEVT